MKTIMGLETEYSIMTTGSLDNDFRAHLREVIRTFVGRKVDLRQIKKCSKGYPLPMDEGHAARPIYFGGMNGDGTVPYLYQWLPNGGLTYIDVGCHVEYSTPECSGPANLVIDDKAGERIIEKRFPRHAVFKNNAGTDFGHPENSKSARRKISVYGCHENYYVPEKLVLIADSKHLASFLATRQIFTGSGSVREGSYTLSQKLRSPNNISKLQVSGRLSVRDGDANMSEMATYMKAGTTAIVLSLLNAGRHPGNVLEDAVKSFYDIACDLSLQHKAALSSPGGAKATAVEIQRAFLDEARRMQKENREWKKDRESADILNRWEYTLDELSRNPVENPWRLGRWYDCWLKLAMLEDLMAKEGFSLGDQQAETFDLYYHLLGEDGLFYMLQARGATERIVTDRQIEEAVSAPPNDTRAFYRGNAVGKGTIRFTERCWEKVDVRVGEKWLIVDLSDPYDPKRNLARQHGLLD
ncbi:MAG: proteasome accessory factor PafA2 family protein [Candidatus Aenigmarchaeota archaeon]|nr:proteasome accessory factor PafA2 family protein [Candidatus Aenigmarchaeota archaeon]